MQSSYIAILVLFLCVILPQRKRCRTAAMMNSLKYRKGNVQMNELVKEYIGKDVIFTLIDGNTADGVAESIDGNWVMLRKPTSDKTVSVNLSYVTRVSEYPLNKKGKRAVFA